MQWSILEVHYYVRLMQCEIVFMHHFSHISAYFKVCSIIDLFLHFLESQFIGSDAYAASSGGIALLWR
jgi:hypothetical protein